MLDCLYTQTFDISPLALVDNQYHPLTFLSNLIDLYALGDKYAISALCRHAAYRFQKTISEISDCEFNLQYIPQIYGSVPENDTTLKDLLIAEIILRYCSYARPRPEQGILLVSRLLKTSLLYSSPTAANELQAIAGNIQDLDW